MKKIIICLLTVFLMNACEAGKFSEERNRLHNMRRDNICEKYPHRCIEVDGTQVDW
ncbi:MAG: hypothetical protein IJ545_06635 [Alphaproteobacteria bacterium]|nr:hypothetical protein [Alphaproteobacteria bacterium]